MSDEFLVSTGRCAKRFRKLSFVYNQVEDMLTAGRHRENNRGVSPVIAVILMVSVTVILGSLVGAYTLGYTDVTEDPPPQSDFTFDWENSSRTLTIEHAAGDSFTPRNTQRLAVVIEDEDETGSNDYLVARTDWANQSNGGFDVTAGDEFVITGEKGGGDLDVERRGTNVANPGTEIHEPEVDDEVRLVWYSPGGEERSFVVARYTIPAGEDP